MVTKMLNAKKLPFGVSISYIDRNSANRDSKTILNNRKPLKLIDIYGKSRHQTVP